MPAELPRVSGELDINIEDEVKYTLVAVYKNKTTGVPYDVSSYAATFTIRDSRGQTGTALLTLTSGSGITVGTTDGKFTIVITDAQAVFGNREMVYDLVITPPAGDPFRLLRGKCTSWAGVK